MNTSNIRIGDIGQIITGNTPKTTENIFYHSNDICIIKPSDIDENIILQLAKSSCYISFEAKKFARIIPPKSVLVSCIGIIGKVAINEVECAFNQQINAIIPNKRICYYKYLAHAIWWNKRKLKNIANAPVVPIINKSQFSDIELPFPSLKEQRRIAAILDKATELIALRKQQIQKLDLLVKSRFIEIFGDMGVNSYDWPEILLQEACRHPNDIKCGPFGTQLNKSEYQSVGVPLLGIPQINSFFNKPATDFVSEAKSKELAAYSLVPGDIAMSRKGNVGMCALYPEHFPNGIIHSDVLRIRINRSKFNPIFILMQLHHSPKIKTQVEVVSSGAIMAGINVTKLKSIAIYAPPLHLQEEFAAFVQKVDKTKSTLQQSLEKLELNYKALMQTYFG